MPIKNMIQSPPNLEKAKQRIAAAYKTYNDKRGNRKVIVLLDKHIESNIAFKKRRAKS